LKAKVLNNQSPGGKRVKLIDNLPLSTPFVIQIFPFYGCNFKCNYCIFQYSKEKRHFISNSTSMDFDLFKKCVNDISKFPDKVKVLRFVGIGEPLLHRKLNKMIEYVKEKNIANTIEILTNASVLHKDLSDKLISSGLDRLVISIQGLNSEKYKEICDYTIDFDKFIDNIKYFYDNKKDVDIYIKIIDTALDSDDDKENFYDLFGNICDSLSIENTVPIHTITNELEERNVTQFGLPVKDIDICCQPFMHLQINPDGNVVPCYSFEYPIILGNCNNESVCDIWSGNKFKDFRKDMIKYTKNIFPICKECNISKYRLFPEDNLNEYKERLGELYK